MRTGVIQKQTSGGGRPLFKGMPVHCIMVHTYLGYKKGYDVHHKDENPLNNSLSNLMYLTHAEHRRLHDTELLHDETRLKRSAALKGKKHKKHKPFSEETRLKMSAAKKGKPTWNKGKTQSAEHKAKISAAMKGKPKSEETRLKMSAAKKAFYRRKSLSS